MLDVAGSSFPECELWIVVVSATSNGGVANSIAEGLMLSHRCAVFLEPWARQRRCLHRLERSLLRLALRARWYPSV